MNRQKIDYFLTSALKVMRGNYHVCPSCGGTDSQMIARKMLVTRLVRCQECGLQYRVPTTTNAESEKFYQKAYAQGFTTEMPDEQTLQQLMAQSFHGTEKDYSPYLAVLDAFSCPKGATLLDFGCSWGYGSWQLMQAGYKVKAFEISVPRCTYARERLGVDAVETLSQIEGTFDVFFSSHVLEHVPSVQKAISFATQVLRPGGLFLAFTPNGSDDFRRASTEVWHKLWGQVHPQFLDKQFYQQAFAHKSRLLTSAPYDVEKIKQWSGEENVEFALEGYELMAAVRL